ncbi:Transcription factor GRAS [Dillenia turbinata]|uniref:Transcription factor GRAS n=1 Tax=Dillenia turbinata TaxID=194707 RepID=A0AAN8UVE6_9MAGN
MDTYVTEFSDSMGGFKLDFESNPLLATQKSSDHSTSTSDSFSGNNLSNPAYPVSSSEDSDFSDAALRYIQGILMEEDLEDRSSSVQDCLALQATEKSFYDLLSPMPDNQPSKSSIGTISKAHVPPTGNFDSNQISDPGEQNLQSLHAQFKPQFNFLNGSAESPVSTLLFSDSPTDYQFFGQSIIALDLGKKNHDREFGVDEVDGRSKKQTAIYSDEQDNTEFWDKVLLCDGRNGPCTLSEAVQQKAVIDEQLKVSSAGKGAGKKKGAKKEVVDLRSLLTSCAQAITTNDFRTANELLKQIRQHSSPSGDASQRVAYYLADGLEARLAGIGTQLYTMLVTKKTSDANILKAYYLYISACPFNRMSDYYANRFIGKVSSDTPKLHIIDFGIGFGYQWPCFIQHLSSRPGGPPMLQITGIDLPRPGFRPAERVEKTGKRLANYCRRFKVLFEFIPIAQKFENVQLEDLGIEKDEFVVVNCTYGLKNTLDDTLILDSPRDTVLKLIKKINPKFFVHGVVNGAYNAPFFVTRFREALFHFSAFLDMLDCNIPRDNQDRMWLEEELCGKEVMNIVACEGSDRIERPETCKQWQARNLRAGFEQLPLDQELLGSVRSKVKTYYHKDFTVEEDGQWMLQEWKGRTLFALSCWKPA